MPRMRDVARAFFRELSPSDRWELGDQLVLGTFDWRDWLPDRPPKGFLRALDEERMLWESEAA